MVESVGKTVGASARIKIAYMHAGALENVQILKSMVESRFDVVESLSPNSPALMVHTAQAPTVFVLSN